MTARFRFWHKQQQAPGRLRPWLIVATAGLLLLSGCGYKGPLTLPPNDLAQFDQLTQHHT